MSLFDSIGDFFSNEKSHMSNMFGDFARSPGKTVAQFALGAEDPFGAALWGKVLGTKFTPEVGQLGGETDAQFAKSRSQGVDTGVSQTLGQIANVVASVWGAYGASGGLGAAAGAGEAGGGAAGGAAADSGSVNLFADAVPGAGGDVGATAGGAGGGGAAADSGSVNLFADAVPGAGGNVGATAGGAGNGAAPAGSGASSWADYAKTAAKVVAPTVLNNLMQPKPPKTKAPTAMPDPLAQQQATQQKLIQQLARRGRASTILTSPSGGGSLGG